VTLVLREHEQLREDGASRWTETFVPGPRTMLRHGDTLIIVTSEASREVTERRLLAVSAGGKLAGWRGQVRGAADR
jgi:cell volume regulation protein A